MPLNDTPEQEELRKTVRALAEKYGYKYMVEKADADEYPTELWKEAGELGFVGVNLPEEYGGGGAGLLELSIVQEELSSQGCGLLMLIVSPAICGSIIAAFGTPDQKQRWLPGIASGEFISAFGITEADAGTNSHNITTTAKKDGDEWVLNGQKTFISGVDQADAVLIVARAHDERTGKLKPALLMVPTDSEGFSKTQIPTEVMLPEWQYALHFDDVRLKDEDLVGDMDAGIFQLFVGLNPERIIATAMATGMSRYALDTAVKYANERVVWDTPIGAHQGLSHPLAQCRIELEQARLMCRNAAARFDQGDLDGAATAANMAKYAAGEVSAKSIDQAVQTLGGNGLTAEYGLARMYAASRLPRIAPVSREMLLNYVAQTVMGLPKSY
ncbi:acyl-CoA dehydrogenase family protein [Corynebacterium glyciniphilum]|uniref:acyl-CoA dehydrogenase family protein n=1 Tax=Corynebacterium glyciniphilum TaxID=1404244 RepID=UPI00265105F2|nr:acyl-CoA dehydrogenase [Corynebacterium glyciniphilum]MDN5683672.1 acyl-CoA dehydrogenase [Corynebacterium glyciniphilum]MDN6705398.1 acyl-CoA dehydrogenase [Corynebacterium glyciniphilum]